MKQYYQMTGEETLQAVNGSLEPLTEEEVRAHQEKYGPNELVEGKKKTVLQIFLEQYKDCLLYTSEYSVTTLPGPPAAKAAARASGPW